MKSDFVGETYLHETALNGTRPRFCATLGANPVNYSFLIPRITEREVSFRNHDGPWRDRHGRDGHRGLWREGSHTHWKVWEGGSWIWIRGHQRRGVHWRREGEGRIHSKQLSHRVRVRGVLQHAKS